MSPDQGEAFGAGFRRAVERDDTREGTAAFLAQRRAHDPTRDDRTPFGLARYPTRAAFPCIGLAVSRFDG